jgi:YidC/Oxa1 family membrane protein insertase
MNLDFLYTAVSWVLLRWYQLFTALGMSKTGGLTWALSIIMLVVTARLLLFRFFVKQVHYQRRMQEMQPKIKKLQDKHKGDRAALQREMMALQQAEGFNPISGCLPMFLQIPIFIALFHVLKHMSNSVTLKTGNPKLRLYGFTETQTLDAAKAKLFNAPLAASLHETSAKILSLGGHVATTRTVTLILVLVSAAATLITQRAVIANQTTPAEGQAAMIQKLMMVGIPVSVVFSGFIFPLGVLLYWFTSNLWTMFQQFYIFKFHPHTPGASVGAAGTVDGAEPSRASVPKVGQKPVHPKSARPTVTSNTPADKISLDKDTNPAGSNGRAENGASAAPVRPAPRGSRPNGNRPGNKRSPSKKRR